MDAALQVVDTATNVAERKAALEKLLELVVSTVSDKKEAIGPQCRHLARTFTAILNEHDIETLKSQANGDNSLGPSMFPQVAEALGLVMVSPADRWLHRGIAAKVIPTLCEEMPKLAPLEDKEQRVATVLSILLFGLLQVENTDIAPVKAFLDALGETAVKTLKSAMAAADGKFPGLPAKVAKISGANICSDEVKIYWEGFSSLAQREALTSAVASWAWKLNSIVSAGDDKYAVLKQIKAFTSKSQDAVFSASVGYNIVEGITGGAAAEGDEQPAAAQTPTERLASLKDTVALLEKEFKVKKPMQQYKSLRGIVTKAFADQTASADIITKNVDETKAVIDAFVSNSDGDKRQGDAIFNVLPAVNNLIAATDNSELLRLAAQLSERVPFNSMIQNEAKPQEALDVVRTSINAIVTAIEKQNAAGECTEAYAAVVEPALHVLHYVLQFKLPKSVLQIVDPQPEADAEPEKAAEAVEEKTAEGEEKKDDVPSTPKEEPLDAKKKDSKPKFERAPNVAAKLAAVLGEAEAGKLKAAVDAVNTTVGATLQTKRDSIKALVEEKKSLFKKKDNNKKKDDVPQSPSHKPGEEPTTPPGTPPTDDLPAPAAEEEKKDEPLEAEKKPEEGEEAAVVTEEKAKTKDDIWKQIKEVKQGLFALEAIESLCGAFKAAVDPEAKSGGFRSVNFSWKGGNQQQNQNNNANKNNQQNGKGAQQRNGGGDNDRRVGRKDQRSFNDERNSRHAPQQRREYDRRDDRRDDRRRDDRRYDDRRDDRRRDDYRRDDRRGDRRHDDYRERDRRDSRRDDRRDDRPRYDDRRRR